MRVSADEARTFVKSVLLKESIDSSIADYVAEGLVHASLRGVDSHGVRLLPHYLEEVKSGRISREPEYEMDVTGSSTAVFDADHGFGHWAGMTATEKAAESAKESGSGIVGVQNSNHFGACSYYSLELAEQNLIGISMTHSDSLVVPSGGVRAFLGNNPISIAAPCADEGPVCLDMATSKITFNEVLKRREEGVEAPKNSGVNDAGEETTDPEEIEHLLPVGGYKGYGLGVMIEILSSLLVQMDYGPHLTKMYDDDLDEKRSLGHLIFAIDIERFSEIGQFKSQVQSLVDELRAEPAAGQESIMVPGDPEKEEQSNRLKNGIPLRETDYEQFTSLADEYSVSSPDLI